MTAIQIFIVDDHPIVRRGLRSLLSNYDDFIVVGEATNVDEAMLDIDNSSADVVLLDIRLPGKSGLDLLDWIKAHHPELKVIILTSFDADEHVYRALRNGAQGFVLKSSSDELLGDAIRTVYRGGRVLSPQVTKQLVEHFSGEGDLLDGIGSEFTPEELHILRLLVDGANNDEIAAELYMSVASIKRRLQKIFAKLGVNNRSLAIAETVRRGLLE